MVAELPVKERKILLARATAVDKDGAQVDVVLGLDTCCSQNLFSPGLGQKQRCRFTGEQFRQHQYRWAGLQLFN